MYSFGKRYPAVGKCARYVIYFVELRQVDGALFDALYRRFKELEPLSHATRYMYWIEPTMLCYEDDSLWAE